ncbi:MAG: hypothetical protein U9Q15_00005, partial [Patescibacteria group bacterium]|nr:hypothetical protein [Patescibacteria group bacterium]
MTLDRTKYIGSLVRAKDSVEERKQARMLRYAKKTQTSVEQEVAEVTDIQNPELAESESQEPESSQSLESQESEPSNIVSDEDIDKFLDEFDE